MPTAKNYENWPFIGDQSDLRVSRQEDLPQLEPRVEAGAALVGGKIRRGFFAPRPLTRDRENDNGDPQDAEMPEHLQPAKGLKCEGRCFVRLLNVGRSDTQAAAQVVREIRKWITHGNGAACVHVLRRTVATTALALSEWASTLSRSVPALNACVAAQVQAHWPLLSLASTWVSQLMQGVASLHGLGIAHLCLSPANIMVSADGTLQVGDFLGKVHVLRFFESTFNPHTEEETTTNQHRLEEWASWYPAEVHRLLPEAPYSAAEASPQNLQSAGRRAGTVSGSPLEGSKMGFRVDAWQLGVTVFHLLTGRVPAALYTHIVMNVKSWR